MKNENSASPPVPNVVRTAPALNPVQMAWLQEIGLDRRLLAPFAEKSGAKETDDGNAASESQARALARRSASPGKAMHASTSSAAGHQFRPASALLAAQRTAVDAISAKNDAKGSGPGPSINETAAVRTAQSTNDATGHAARIDDLSWAALETHVAACQACDLHQSRSQAVFGRGQAESPEWMVIGEAPGQQDDRVGLPFQGRAGVLLDAMLEAVGIQTGTAVYFSNLIKCRPLGNRTPTPQEAAACLPYLQRQIDILQPRAILVLGKLAAQSLLGLDTDLDEIRGRIHHLRTESGRQIPVVATYHPASLLSRSQHKADAWRDLNLARSAISGAAKSEAATDGVRP